MPHKTFYETSYLVKDVIYNKRSAIKFNNFDSTSYKLPVYCYEEVKMYQPDRFYQSSRAPFGYKVTMPSAFESIGPPALGLHHVFFLQEVIHSIEMCH